MPQVLLVPALVGLALLVVPLGALVARVEWTALGADITSPEALSALGLSLATALVATAMCLLLGVPLALLIARSGGRTASVLRAIVTLPLVLPPMVGGVALLFLFVGNLLQGFVVDGFGPALLGSILYSVIAWILASVLLGERN